jgi:ribokinase
VSTHAGGGAVNAAVAMARLGMDVAVLAKLGSDERADTILRHLKHEGVSTAWVRRDPRLPTGASVLISSHDRNAAIFTFRGANTLLEVGDLHDEAFAVDVVYIANLSNESADCFPAIVERAKKTCRFGCGKSRTPAAFGPRTGLFRKLGSHRHLNTQSDRS